MTRLELFEQVRASCVNLYSPEMEAVWRPILEQLDYLIAFENGDEVDRSLLQNIDIGLRALRNLDEIYPEITKSLFEVQRKAEQMATENGMKNRIAL